MTAAGRGVRSSRSRWTIPRVWPSRMGSRSVVPRHIVMPENSGSVSVGCICARATDLMPSAAITDADMHEELDVFIPDDVKEIDLSNLK